MKAYAGRMTRTHAARQLLAHGPLTQPEFLEITGWKPKVVSLVTQRLMQTGDVVPVNLSGTRHYALASSSITSGLPHGIGTMPNGLTAERGSNCHG